MKEEFVTLYGKAVIERDVLFFRSIYLPFDKTAFAEIGIEILWILVLAGRIVSIDSNMDLMVAIVWGVLVAFRFPRMYQTFFKRSYASRIPVTSIQNITTHEDGHNMQTKVKLHLNNGRYKLLIFRNREGELERFASALSQYQINTEKAIVGY